MAGAVNGTRLLSIKRRLSTNPPVDMSADEKVASLEQSLNVFKAEVEMKLSIIQQIITSRNGHLAAQKQLLEREEDLFSTLLEHWTNTPQLAANGFSVSAATLFEDFEDLPDPVHDPPVVKISRSAQRRARARKTGQSSSQTQVHVSIEPVVIDDDGVNESEDPLKTETEDYFCGQDQDYEEGFETNAGSDLMSTPYKNQGLGTSMSDSNDYLEFDGYGDDDSPSSAPVASHKRKLKPNSVWNCYIRNKTPAGLFGKCKVCGKEVNAYGGTTSLKRHITSHHKELLIPLEVNNGTERNYTEEMEYTSGSCDTEMVHNISETERNCARIPPVNTEELNYFENQKGGLSLLHNGFTYRKTKSTQSSTYWICTKHEQEQCHARCVVKDGTIVDTGAFHNHTPEAEEEVPKFTGSLPLDFLD